MKNKNNILLPDIPPKNTHFQHSKHQHLMETVYVFFHKMVVI